MILAIDVGTTSLKLGVYDESLQNLAKGEFAYSLDTPDPSTVRIDPDIWWKAFLTTIKKTDYPKDRIHIIVLSVNSPGFSVMDRDGNPLMPSFTHLDRRAYAQSKKILDIVGEKNAPRSHGEHSQPRCVLRGEHPLDQGASLSGHLQEGRHVRAYEHLLRQEAHGALRCGSVQYLHVQPLQHGGLRGLRCGHRKGTRYRSERPAAGVPVVRPDRRSSKERRRRNGAHPGDPSPDGGQRRHVRGRFRGYRESGGYHERHRDDRDGRGLLGQAHCVLTLQSQEPRRPRTAGTPCTRSTPAGSPSNGRTSSSFAKWSRTTSTTG